jgi:glycosyltransferase involved in cell wall biosynthesis
MSNKLRVLQFGRYFPPHIGGTENVIYDLSEGLNKKGIVCDVLCCNDTNDYVEESESGYTVIRTQTILKIGSIAISPQQIFKLRSIWRKYDIIHVHHPAPMATLALWIVNPACKIIVYWHSDIIRQKILLFFFKPFQNWLLKKASAIVATTPEYINGSEALLKYPLKTSFIPIGIGGMANASNSEPQLEIKKQYANKKIIFSLGRLVEYKGYEYLVEAAKYLSDDYVILIGGEGRLKGKLLQQIDSNGLANRVKLLGKLSQKELPQYFMLCDLFCLSSITKNEAFGLVLAEAMSVGKPIVATRIPGSGVHWVNQDSVTGLNVEIQNGKRLAEAIKTILENPDKKLAFQRGALDRYHMFFKKEMMVHAFSQLYYKILDKD